MAPPVLVVRSEKPTRVQYRGKGRIHQSFPVAAIAVIRGQADFIDKKGRKITPKEHVPCRKKINLTRLPSEFDSGELVQWYLRHAGSPISTLDPGEDHEVFLLPKAKGTPVNPVRVIEKNLTRPVGECFDIATACCDGCCNNKVPSAPVKKVRKRSIVS